MTKTNLLILLFFFGILIGAIVPSYFLFSYTPSEQIYDITSFEVVSAATDSEQEHSDISMKLTDIASLTENGIFKKGDHLTLTTILPDANYDFPTLCMSTGFCGYRISLNGEMLCTYQIDAARKGDFIPREVQYVTLPEKDLSGARLTITLYISEPNISVPISSVRYGDYNDVVLSFLHKRLFSAYVGTFLAVFGALYLVISLLFASRMRGLTEQILGSLICICGGAWLLTAQNITSIYPSAAFSPILEYASLYLSLPLILLMFGSICQFMRRKPYIILLLGNVIIELFFIFMHVSGIRHLNQFRIPFCCMYLFYSGIMFVYSVYFLKHKKARTSIKVQLIGIDLLVLSLVVTAAYFLFRGISEKPFNPLVTFFLACCASIFVVSRLMTYMFSLTEYMSIHQQEKALSMLAYKDSLTQLPNRTSCDNEFISLDDSDDDYLIMSLDLNGLKEINDSLGHAAGDNLICNFADILNMSFPNPAFRARVGGDEFVVILRTLPNEDYLQSHIQHMKELLNAKDQSTAYGYCFRHELGSKANSHLVYMKADARMYDCKKLQHEINHL